MWRRGSSNKPSCTSSNTISAKNQASVLKKWSFVNSNNVVPKNSHSYTPAEIKKIHALFPSFGNSKIFLQTLYSYIKFDKEYDDDKGEPV